MTSPTGGGSEHVSRYRALGEFDNLVRAAKEAKRALKELREEEAKLNAQSLADDKKIVASKQERAKAEKASTDSAKKAIDDLNTSGTAGKSGEAAGVSYSRGLGKGIQQETQSGSNRQFVDAATKALQQAFANAGTTSGTAFSRKAKEAIRNDARDEANTKAALSTTSRVLEQVFAKAGEDSGREFLVGVRQRFRRDASGALRDSGFEYSLREMVDRSGRAGRDSGTKFVLGIAEELKALNNNLHLVGFDKLELDVDIDDAKQAIEALEFELTQLSHTTANPQIRIDTNRALINLRAIQKLFRDEVAENMVKDAERIRKELAKLDELPSGKAFKFWALTAVSDMTRVFEEAEKGTSVFEKLRLAFAGGGGGGNFFRTAISGFDDFSESSSNLLQRLGRVSGELYRMPGLIAVLVASLPALVSGLGALAGGALGLSSGLGASLGVIAAFPAAGTALLTSVGALGGTFGGFVKILEDAKQARMEELEAQEQQRLGTEKALTAQQKYNLALKDMGPATEAVTEAVVDFSEKWAESQKIVGENFFKEVVDNTDRLNDVLPIAENLLGRAAGALGRVADAGIKMITSGPWKRDFQQISKDNAVFIENMGFAGLSLAEAFKDIMIAAAPFTTWLTKGIREGAEAFADWADEARNTGTIEAFLGETQESLESLWQILKNLGNVVNSFFQSTVDEGQSYLRTLEDITGHWADVAEAQEEANSPLRQWMVQIRPILSGLGSLIKDLANGIAGLATNQNSVQAMVDLLDSLRTDVLPPILSILQHLNDSGIAVTVVQALGDILNAISEFLDSGATQALTVFVTVLAEFFTLVADIASLPVISDILGGVAAAIAALAAVSIVARFTGLFKLWDFFNWMTRNRGNLAGAFADAARGVAGLPTGGNTNLPDKVPSTIGGIGTEVTGGGSEKQITRTGDAAQKAAPKVGIFSRAVAGIGSAGGTAARGLGGLTDFLGGPWGIALAGATVAIGVIVNDMQRQKKEAEDTRNAWLALADAYDQLKAGDSSGVEALARTDEKFRELATGAEDYGISLADLSGALNGNEQASARVNAILDAQAAAYKENDKAGNANRQVAHLNMLGLQAFRDELDTTANAQREANKLTDDATAKSRTYEERLGGLTQEQVESAQAAASMEGEINLLNNALDALSSATSTSTDKSKAFADLIEYETGTMQDANEATENWNSTLLDLREAVESNGKSLSTKTREGLKNRDALEAAAKATRNLYLEDIASGRPMDESIRRHQNRIKELKEEAKRLNLNKEETKKLIDIYGDVPESLKTDIKTDEKGFASVYTELARLQVMQKALMEGKSLSEAQKDWNKESSKYYERYIPGKNYGDGYGSAPGYATGGPVWGAGTRTSDSIRAWLSNGEFVQPTDSVEYYGLPLMEAIRSRKLDKQAIQEALPDANTTAYANGGPAHSANCPSCASGGHKFANGGSVTVPIEVDPSNTLIKKEWATKFAGALGAGGGGKGYQWQMKVLRAAFPGLPLWSGYRPGSRTLSGNQSYHALGRAVDLPPRRDVAAWIRANYGANTKELITPYNDLNLWNGKPHRYTGAVWNQHNFAGGNAHDHWAFNQGGMVDLMNMLNMDNIAPKQSTSLPTTPRTLSPAASSVVNNSTDNTRTFGDVIINNPAPERAGDSVRDALYRTSLLY